MTRTRVGWDAGRLGDVGVSAVVIVKTFGGSNLVPLALLLGHLCVPDWGGSYCRRFWWLSPLRPGGVRILCVAVLGVKPWST